MKEARTKAREIGVEADKGIDRVAIAEEKKRHQATEKANRVTVHQAIDAYFDLHLSTLRSGDERRRQLLQALASHLEQPVTALTRLDLQAAVDLKAQSGTRPYANRIRAALVAFANWGFLRGYMSEPIGAGIAKATKEAARERQPSIGEVRTIWAASWDMGELWGPFFRLLILTGQRRGEIARLRWGEVDFENREIFKPGSETKNGRPHRTHLADPAMRELLFLRKSGGASDFVFTFDGTNPVANPSHAKRRIDEHLGKRIEPWRIHDLRTAMASALAEAGEPEAVVDRILNHSASGSAPSAVSRIYQQSDLLPQRARALDRWAGMVLSAETDIVEFSGVRSRSK